MYTMRCVCLCSYRHNSVDTAVSRTFPSHSLARFPICCDSAEFSEPELLPQIGTAANTRDHRHFCVRSRKALNAAVLFLRRPFPLGKLYPKVEMPAKDPAEKKKQ